MKLGFVIRSVGPAINSAAGLSAFCLTLEGLGYDTLWVADRLVTPVDMQATYPGKEQPYPALGSQVVRTAQFAHDVLRGMPLPTSHVFLVPSHPTSGHRTLKLVGLIQRKYGRVCRTVCRKFRNIA
jgi:hypothetical protein